MIEVSLSFLAWLSVLFIQAMVHLKVVYLRKIRDEDEPRMIERDSLAASETTCETEEDLRQAILTRSYNSDPALEDDFDEDHYDDEPPNLEHRLSQTGSEMMNSCKSLESIVNEQIQILAQ